MTEITRVPLRPIQKGSLTKLWLGVLAAIALGAGLAWAAAPKSAGLEVLAEGDGTSPQIGDVAFVTYVGKLADGTEFDRSRPLPIPPGLLPDGTPMLLEEGAIIPGFLDGMLKMEKGGKYLLTIPSDQAYGAEPPAGSPIPANADLVFEVELVDFMSRADFEAKAQQIQAMMSQMGASQGDSSSSE